MSTFLENIKINNLQKKVNALATEVSNIIVGGAPVISGDIDMNNNSITEIDQLVYNSGNALIENNGTLTFANKELLTTDDLAPYQLQTSATDINVNNHRLLNVNGLIIVDDTNVGTTKNFTLINGGLVSADEADTRVYLYTNQSGDMPTNLDFMEYTLRNVGQIEFSAMQSILNTSDGSSLLFNNNKIAQYALEDDINGQNQHELRQITGIQLTSGGSLTFGTQNELSVNPGTQNLIYNNVPIVNASDFASYLPDPQWVGTATSSLNMQNYNITNITNLTAGAVNPNSINFNNDTSKKLTYLNSHLQFQGANVITSSDLASYLPEQTFIPLASTDLNMNNNHITNASSISFPDSSVLTSSDNLLYNGSIVITENNFSAQFPSVGSFTQINFNSDINCILAGITDGLYYRNQQMATVQYIDTVSIGFTAQDANQNGIYNLGGIGFNVSDLQLTMNNNGDALWSGATILTTANTNIPPANQVYNVSDQSSLIFPNISILANSTNYIKGTIIGSTFVIEFSAVAINIGGNDPAWIEDTQTTNIIYGPTNSTFEELYFNATNAGLYLAMQFKEAITDTITAKIEQLYNA